ncbi:MAG: DUF4105 domain-containing protein [Gammaproteobacteria bacterium]
MKKSRLPAYVSAGRSALPNKPKTNFFKSAIRITGILCMELLLLCAAGWGVLALYFFDHASHDLRTTLAVLFALISLLALIGFVMPRWRWRMFLGYLALFALLLYAWNSLTPSNTGDWQTDVAVLPYAVINGDLITVHNIRDFDYRTDTDYTPGYYDKTFDMKNLAGVDLIAVYWMGPAIAHIFLSFDFQNDQHLAISIETRKHKGQGYSTLQGFFRQYPIYYVVADERDVIRLRTNFRKDPSEDVYLYRINGSVENGRRLFLAYMHKINTLRDKPEWYNTLTTNCTTAIWMLNRINPGHPSFSWKILASGYVPEYLYAIGRLDTNLPFAHLRRLALINARAQAADDSADFSQLIRVGVPGEKTFGTPKK